MALLAGEQSLQIVIKARDEASKQIKQLSGRLDKMQPTFRKMSVLGTAAFAGIATGAGMAVRAAADAEGAYNKFNAVFKEHSDDMMTFVEDLREEMPTATNEIVRMAADMQDLLVPMGLARDEATGLSKGFLDVANKVAAFNDVNPTEVLEAIKSGLAGSSEPLRRFGINALESSLEAEALEEGLLDAGQSFKDLEPKVKSAIRAQALYAQIIDDSSDALNGFDANQDSFLRRWQNLQATLQDLKVTIGTALMPVFDDLIKSIQPVINKVVNWIEENPKLTKNIVLVAGAIAGLVAVLGTLGLAISGMKTAFTAFSTVLKNPVVLSIAVVVASMVQLARMVKALMEKAAGMKLTWKEVWEIIAETVIEAVEKIVDAIKSVVDWVDKAISKLKRFTRARASARARSAGATPGARASGGPVQSNQPYLVGERGPELFLPMGAGRIIPNDKMGGGTQNNFVVNINNPHINSQRDLRDFEGSIERTIRGLMRDNKLQSS